ncbi:MAG TPA: MFS transporter [Bordetella sp.]
MARDSGSGSTGSITLQILPCVVFTFFCYLSVGLQLAVLPGYVHNVLGFGPVVTGLAVSMQSIATLVTRSHAGGLSDTMGPKRAVLWGQAMGAGSGVLLLMAYAFERSPGFSLGLLLAGRCLLGFCESLVATSGMTWGLGRVGPQHTARVISWNGVSTYSGLALGAPIGVQLAGGFSFGAIGAAVLGVGLISMVIAWGRPDVARQGGVRLPYRSVMARVLPFGLGLGLGTIGLGMLTAFVTLYYASRHWDGAALVLTVFGCSLVLVRLVSGNAIPRFGGFSVALVSLLVEAVGLALIWLAPSPAVVLVGAVFTGMGFSLLFPALGVEVVARMPAGSRGASIGVFSVFFDVALAVAGPLAGYISQGFGFAAIYLAATCTALLAAALVAALRRGWWVGQPA